MSKAPDLALRRLVADLAGLGPADVAAILADLAPAQQARVRAMLAALNGQPAPAPALAPVEELWSPALAPWLRERLGEGLADDGDLTLRPPRPTMTPAGREALARAAHAAGAWITAPPPAAAPVTRKSQGVDVLLAALRGGRR